MTESCRTHTGHDTDNDANHRQLITSVRYSTITKHCLPNYRRSQRRRLSRVHRHLRCYVFTISDAFLYKKEYTMWEIYDASLWKSDGWVSLHCFQTWGVLECLIYWRGDMWNKSCVYFMAFKGKEWQDTRPLERVKYFDLNRQQR